ncbi:hypothetical protein F4813DRAFT_386524 [Daldinia decipiens]|uniref:uncharacterized protein n=1 Tax=Daldinia decipiens TaxID=326647 RepID=UPI0020C37318|nr:uncharacterized protein F4813DRAFT_386524 [Daldinia decipiens]KAI1660321.1 hypothetical protein F4813DRAFT_386524 [Daldinia decipiens]
MTHRRQRSRRVLDLTALLAMVSTSSAVNLTQFQLIISNSIPKSCIRAYQTEIDGCKVDDFTGGRQCSASCVKGVQQVQDLVQEACGDLNVSHKSLLGIVLSGDLVDTLCPGQDPTSVTTTVQPSSTKGGSSTIVTAPTSSPTDTSRTTEKTTSTTSSTSASASASASASTSASGQSTTTQSTTDQEISSPTATATNSPTDTTSKQNTAQPTTPSEPTQSTSSDAGAPIPFFAGAPFDTLPPEQGLSTVLSPRYCKEALVVAICAAMLLLR